MELTSTRIVAAPLEQVWAALNDPEVLKEAVPGCETLERVTDNEWRAVVAAKVGPVSARFTGKMLLADLDPPNGYTLKFEGQGGAAGFANGRGQGRARTGGGGQDRAELYGEGAGRRQARADRLAAHRRRGGQARRRFLRALCANGSRRRRSCRKRPPRRR